MYERRSRSWIELVGVHRNPRIRTVIAEETQKASSVCGEIEVDESYFGGLVLAGKSRFSGF